MAPTVLGAVQTPLQFNSVRELTVTILVTDFGVFYQQTAAGVEVPLLILTASIHAMCVCVSTNVCVRASKQRS